jgi:TM2 domain-containing membrane protein YozV
MAADNHAYDQGNAGGRLNDMQRLLIEQKITNQMPSVGVAYLLWFLLWPFGAHRFYLGRTGTGIVFVVLSITVVGLIVSGIWAFVDLFLIPGIVRERMEVLRSQFTLQALANG